MKVAEINVKVTGEKQNPKESFRQDKTREFTGGHY
jgi:hypothetical protein